MHNLLQLKPGWGYISARHTVHLARPLKLVRTTERCCRHTDWYMCFGTHSKPSQSATDWQLLNSEETNTVFGHRNIFPEKLNTKEHTPLKQYPLHFLLFPVAATGEQLVNWEPSLKRTKPVSKMNKTTDKASSTCAQLNIRSWKHSSVEKVALQQVCNLGFPLSVSFHHRSIFSHSAITDAIQNYTFIVCK